MPAKHSYPTMEPLAYLLQMVHNRDETVTGVSVQHGSIVVPEDPLIGFDDEEIGIETRDVLPVNVVSLIENRASAWIKPLAESFAAEASSLEGVELRVQQSKGDPWYFQVRHPRFAQLVAYVHPRQTELRIEYRLTSDHETYGGAQRRDNFYGIVMKVRQSAGLPIAFSLLRDALARES